MTRGGRVRKLFAATGELIARHEGGASLDEFASYRDDPVRFAEEVLGWTPWSRQVEILEAVRDHSQVHVQGANAVGKDAAAAVGALWWTFAHRGLVLATAAVERQLVDVFMGEVGGLWRRAPDLPGELYRGALRVPGAEHAGVVTFTSTEASKLTGYHAPRVLAVLTEAQAVEDFAWEGLVACATGPEDRLLAVGNPTRPSGRFYKAARSGAWRTIRVPVREHPNLREDADRRIPGGPSEDFVRRVAREWGEGSPQYAARVDATFPETSEDSLVEVDWLDRAFDAHRDGAFAGDAQQEYAVVGVDVARYGSDATVCCIRRGRAVTRWERWQGADTRETSARVMKLVREEADGGRSPVKEVVVDATAVGGGVADSLREELPGVTWYEAGRGGRDLREKSPTLREFVGGERAPDPSRYRNLRSQAIWAVRDRLEEGELSLPPDDGLRRELLAHRYEVASDGRTGIVSKDEIKSRLGGASPDRVDALSMTFTSELEEEGGVELMIGGASR